MTYIFLLSLSSNSFSIIASALHPHHATQQQCAKSCTFNTQASFYSLDFNQQQKVWSKVWQRNRKVFLVPRVDFCRYLIYFLPLSHNLEHSGKYLWQKINNIKLFLCRVRAGEQHCSTTVEDKSITQYWIPTTMKPFIKRHSVLNEPRLQLFNKTNFRYFIEKTVLLRNYWDLAFSV